MDSVPIFIEKCIKLHRCTTVQLFHKFSGDDIPRPS